MTHDTSNPKSIERQFIFIDESGSPYFDPNRPEEGFVAVSTLIPEEDLAAARLVVPRLPGGELIKSSGQDATDELAACFIGRLFAETRTRIGLVTAALSDPSNADRMKRMKNGIGNSRLQRRVRPSIADALRMSAAFDALALSLVQKKKDLMRYNVQIVFDRGSERPEFMEKARAFMCSSRPGAPLVIEDVRWVSRDEEPLIMVSDWIAGSVRRDIHKNDLPLTRQILRRAKEEGRLHDKEGFTAYLPIESASLDRSDV